MNGITDNPPYVLTASQIVSHYLDDGNPDGKLSDGSQWYVVTIIDHDYLMGHLLSIYTPWSNSVDWIAAFVRHGRHPDKGWDFDCEWRSGPMNLLDNDRPYAEVEQAAMHWFVDWTAERHHEYAAKLSNTRGILRS